MPWRFASGSLPINAARAFVQRLFYRDNVSLVFGASGCRKSFWLLDLAFHVVMGWAWRGLGVERGAVVYVCLEGESGFMNRVVGLLKVEHGIKEEIPMVIRTVPVEMMSENKAKEFCEWVENEVAPEVLRRWGLPVVWVIVDTLSQDTAGHEENNENYSTIVRNGRAVASRLQVEFTFVHHTGKDELRGARGGYALKANINTEIEVRDEGDYSVAETTKVKDGRTGDQFPFKLRVVDLGVPDQWGEMITTCVVEPLTELPRKERGLSGQPLSALWILRKGLAANGIFREDTGIDNKELPTEQSLYHEDDWFELCLSEGFARDAKSRDNKRRTFNRATKKLIDGGFVAYWKGYAWIPG